MKSLGCTLALGIGIATAGCAVGNDDAALGSGESIDESADAPSLPDENDGGASGPESGALAVVGTTSICTTSIFGPTQRYDKVRILSGTNEAAERLVLVTNGAVQRTQRIRQVNFIESGGQLDEALAPRYRTWAYVAGGGAINQFGGERAFVKDRGFVSCQPTANQTILSEPGATFSGCSRTLQSTPSFRRCSSTTPVAQVFPTARISMAQSGTTFTFRNTSSGYYEAVRWRVQRECYLGDGSDQSFNYAFAQSTNRTSYSISLPKSSPDCQFASYLVELELTSRGFPTVSTYRIPF